MRNTFIHSRSPLKTIPDCRPKWANSIPFFRPKRRKNLTIWGGTYVYGLYEKVPPPGGGAYGYLSHTTSRAEGVFGYYFGGARSKGFATLRNVSKLQFFDKIGQAKSVGFRFYSAI